MPLFPETLPMEEKEDEQPDRPLQEYKLLVGGSEGDFEKTVTDYINENDGWELHAGPAVASVNNSIVIVQALIWREY